MKSIGFNFLLAAPYAACLLILYFITLRWEKHFRGIYEEYWLVGQLGSTFERTSLYALYFFISVTLSYE